MGACTAACSKRLLFKKSVIDIFPVENTPMFTEPVRQLIRQHPKLKPGALFTELWTVFEQIPGEFADFFGRDVDRDLSKLVRLFFSCYQITTKKCLGISFFFQRAAIHCFYISGKEAISSFSSRVKPVFIKKT